MIGVNSLLRVFDFSPLSLGYLNVVKRQTSCIHMLHYMQLILYINIFR